MIRRELRNVEISTRSRDVERAIVKPPIIEAYRPSVVLPPAPILAPKLKIAIPEVFEKAITRPKVGIAVAVKVEDQKFSESLVKKMLQNVQARNTILPVDWKSPDIRTGVCGKIAPMPVSKPFGVPSMPVKYPVGTPQRPPTGISPSKAKELKAGKLNIIDKFFLFINAILK
ncbi:hypothetical protein ES702_07680 [subsurface metagenome]